MAPSAVRARPAFASRRASWRATASPVSTSVTWRSVARAMIFPPITAYAIMQVGKLALVPYYPPGEQSLADAVRKLAGRHHAVLPATTGP